METFNFPYHTVETQYPETGVRVQFGGGYTFAAEPPAPDQKMFVLHFPAMRYFFVSGVIDANVNPMLNIKNLSNFYEAHRLHVSFLYTHEAYGEMEVKFNKPLKIPQGVPGGFAVVKDFDIELLEIV